MSLRQLADDIAALAFRYNLSVADVAARVCERQAATGGRSTKRWPTWPWRCARRTRDVDLEELRSPAHAREHRAVVTSRRPLRAEVLDPGGSMDDMVMVNGVRVPLTPELSAWIEDMWATRRRASSSTPASARPEPTRRSGRRSTSSGPRSAGVRAAS
jgi:hypothetical protein